MKRLAFGAAWLVLFIVALWLASLSAGIAPLAFGHGIIGAAAGALLFAVAAALGWLPGARPPQPVRWGTAQAFWLVFWFLGMQLVAAVACQVLASLAGWLIAGRLAAPPLGGPGGAVLPGAVTGYVAASLWALWYIRRRGPAPLRDGSVTGIAWAPAPARAYRLAVAFAVIITLLVGLIIHLYPPDLQAVSNLPAARLFARPGLPAATLLLLAVFIAPPMEELVFRGGVFSALAVRLSPLWAGVVTTLLFMAVHAPEKYAYPPGFIDVGLMAAAATWLRVRFGSIKPGMLLHLLYNAGLMLAAGAAGGG